MRMSSMYLSRRAGTIVENRAKDRARRLPQIMRAHRLWASIESLAMRADASFTEGDFILPPAEEKGS